MSATAVPLLQVRHLRMEYPVGRGWWGRRKTVFALDNVSLQVHAGETVAVVGESGCGKSTLGKCILRLVEPTGGEVLVDGEHFIGKDVALRPELRQKMQVVFQDPYASLNPRRTIFQTVSDPLRQMGMRDRREIKRRVEETLSQVGLGAAFMQRHPHELSGGQRQRVAIARAIVTRPKLIVCDEPISSLDISIQAQVINLLRRLQTELGIAYLFITHNFGVVEYLADRIAVMEGGRIIELGQADAVLHAPRQDMTRRLLAAVPRLQFGPPGAA